LRTTLIIVKDERVSRIPTSGLFQLPASWKRAALWLLPLVVAAPLVAAQVPAAAPVDLVAAKREAAEAKRRSEQLERQAAQAIGVAQRAQAEAAALASRIEAAEAEITASQTRIGLIERLQAEQRARLAERQAPLIRLTAALQTMGRRPSALALVQPGSIDEVVHVRALLASTLPAIRARTAMLRAEVARGNDLRRQALLAAAAMDNSRRELQRRRIALARFEDRQRAKSESLLQTAGDESDRALAFGEEARDLAEREGTLAFQAQLRRRLASLPGPAMRPVNAPPPLPARASRRYMLPVQGRLVTGLGEISDAGVHARGLTFETAPDAPVSAPRSGRIVYAGPFRSYGQVVLVDHGGGWISAITDLTGLAVKAGDAVAMGQAIGRAGPARRVSVELRRNGRPFPIVLLLGG
jgi:septal ring factor EnvC (AmiA/AmiB activator)